MQASLCKQICPNIGIRYLLLLLLFFLLPAQGADNISAYQGEVPVASYLSEDWQKALAPALEQVLIKMSGNPNIAQISAVHKAMAKPNSMVQTFTYTDHDSDGKKSLMLQVHFSPTAIDSLLQNTNESDSTTENTTTDISSDSNKTPVDNVTAQATSPTQNVTPLLINMVVSGVHGLQDYTALLDYVRHLEGVITVDSKQIQGDRMLLVVKINNTITDLTKVIEQENKLVKKPIADKFSSSALLLSYQWMTDTSIATPVVIPNATPTSINNASTQSFAVPPSDHNFTSEEEALSP